MAGVVSPSSDGTPTLTNLLEGRSTCSTDPAASDRAGIDWCDDLARFPSLRAIVIEPNAASASPDFFHQVESWANPSFAFLEATALGAMATQSVIGYATTDPLETVSDALLYLGTS